MDSVAANQARTFLDLFARLRPFIRTDKNFPSRVQQTLAREKRFGSRDRRLYRELIYTAVRFLPWIEELDTRLGASGVVHAIAALAGNTPATTRFREHHAPDWLREAPLGITEKAARLGVASPLMPDWFAAHCPAAGAPAQLEALHTRAPLWLRLQTEDREAVFQEFAQRGITWRVSDILPDAVKIVGEPDITQTDAYARGLIEVQDLGSQLILATAAPLPQSRWLDACAGAGGKTLQLARLLGPRGHVDATDPRAEALDELRRRAARAGLSNITLLSHAAGARPADYDGVLVDAPCSGTGTWRRAPHLKWSTRPEDIEAAARLQREILDQHARLVRPGGFLVYATCSLCQAENDDVASGFLARHPAFTATTPPKTILPAEHDTDGFFVAIFRRGA